MQSEIFDLMETDTYSKQTWSSANTEQHKKILRSFIGEINQIMGLNVNEINFEKLGRGTRGYYSPKTNSVTINEDYLSRKDSYQIMQTSVHEMRHAYQHAAMDQPQDFTVSQETVDRWRENDKNYKTVDKDGYDAYVGQPVEWDAKNFAKQYSDVEGKTPEYAGSWGE